MHDGMVLGEQLVAWNGCRIRVDVLDRIRARYEAMDPRDVADVSHAVEQALHGMDVYRWEDLPAKVRSRLLKALGLGG